ncbi:hypothetical protein COCVIDRAFT_24460 [Bipolaris victoriae FI3]|uniref:Uncharacterized protein n=1 Tax=Bipolaris victoriae (strain FI3) TaxID=930091 RepID=W7F0A3_BIPV3|nr:hypothetical protein COCVIDRAFT_24460 [Bipolaris victoriae FI3]
MARSFQNRHHKDEKYFLVSKPISRLWDFSGYTQYNYSGPSLRKYLITKPTQRSTKCR